MMKFNDFDILDEIKKAVSEMGFKRQFLSD